MPAATVSDGGVECALRAGVPGYSPGRVIWPSISVVAGRVDMTSTAEEMARSMAAGEGRAGQVWVTSQLIS